MATLTTASMTRPDTMVKIRIRPTAVAGFSWNGVDYNPGDVATVPAWFAAAKVGGGRADLVDDDEGTTPPGVIDSRDPEPRRRR
jgi:hypothetical protein